MNSFRVGPYSRSHPICYGSVKSWLMTRYFCEFVSLIEVGPPWGQRLQYAKILKAPCEKTGNGLVSASNEGLFILDKCFGVRLQLLY